MNNALFILTSLSVGSLLMALLSHLSHLVSRSIVEPPISSIRRLHNVYNNIILLALFHWNTSSLFAVRIDSSGKQQCVKRFVLEL